MNDRTRYWVEETVDAATGEPLVFNAATEAELDAQIGAWFGDEPADTTESSGTPDPSQREGEGT